MIVLCGVLCSVGDSDSVGLLFMGGCYKTESQPGSEICTAAKDGVCTACKADNGLFKNPAAPQKPGSECILCHDATGADGYTGVENCAQCTKSDSNKGAATCTECQDGYYKNAQTCTKCNDACLTCDGSGQNACTSCPEGKYLKGDNTCVDANQCGADKYADKKTWTCKACDPDITGCTACAYEDATGGPVCSTCGSPNSLVKTASDGTTTCVDANGCKEGGMHFVDDGNTKCILCSDTNGGSPNDQGKDNCKKCTKANSGQPPECSACLDGYFFDNSAKTCTNKCAPNCAMCSEATTENKCLTCKEGFFLKVSGTPGQCFACDSVENGGIDGCAECTNSGTFKCTKCKVNYRPSGDSSTGVTCTKICEDETACGGTSGACDAMIIDDQGNTKNYCSYCGDSTKVPIDGLCVSTGSNANGNTCTSHTCTSCAQGYFLYMGGCYSVLTQPGKSMCKTSSKEGICTEAASNKYFLVPEATNAQQSVLACSNPLGTLIGTQDKAKAYVGVDGCSQCTAPTPLTGAGMAPAVCTACSGTNKPNLAGSGCFACAVEGCSHCNRDNMCEKCDNNKKVSPGRKSCVDGCPSNSTDTDSVCVCNDGYSPDDAGASCVSSGANRSGLSTGAIAGISVAVVAVVGGLVGFLCWWFVCRGKA
eukprot:XP_001707663.1 VSP [Giardia lamblia ATCC 50803]